MFKRILIPTDGSPASAKAIKAGIAFAKKNGSRVIGYHSVDPMRRSMHTGEGYIPSGKLMAEIERRLRAAAKKYVTAIGRVARKEDVEFEALVETADTPYRAIVDAAARRKCDLIFMGTHGYTGFTRFALGSVAEKVVRLSKVPVLVYR
jgi:nucleotide-binding universal stress UspA family protein